MAAVHHDALGMGEMPAAPIVSYLARTASLLYVIHGAVMIFVSFDIPRYRPLIVLIGFMNGLCGAAWVAIDLAAGVPAWWTVVEGPVILAVATVTVALAWRGGTAAAC
jgi:hypothetical protein